MAHDELLKRLRLKLGLSISEMAYLLGLSGNNASDRIREIERGARDLSGATLNLIAYIEAAAFSESPRFVHCVDHAGYECLTHNHWPRFTLQRFNAAITPGMQAKIDAGRVVVLTDNNDAQRAALHWVDDPIKDHEPLINDALKALIDYEQYRQAH